MIPGQDPWAARTVRPRPTEMAWGPWMQVSGDESGTLIARTLETVIGEVVIHFTPDALERFCKDGLLQARMARAGIITVPGLPDDNGTPSG